MIEEEIKRITNTVYSTTGCKINKAALLLTIYLYETGLKANHNGAEPQFDDQDMASYAAESFQEKATKA